MTREAVTLRVHRHERKVDTRIAVHHDRVHDVVLIERDRDGRRQRRDEAVEQQVHAVIVDLHLFEDSVRRLFERTRRKDVLDTEDTFLLQHFLLTVWFALVVLLADMLTDTNRHVRVHTRGVDVFLHEGEVLPESLLEVHLDIIQRKRHTAVRLRGVLLGSGHAVFVFVGNDVLDQLHSRVTFAFVIPFAVLRRHHDVLQSIDIRMHLDLHVLTVLTGTQGHHLRLVTQHLEVQTGITRRVAQREITV